MPNRIISQGHRRYVLRNFEGRITTYVEPEGYEPDCHCDVCKGLKKDEMTGIINLSQGKLQYLE